VVDTKLVFVTPGELGLDVRYPTARPMSTQTTTIDHRRRMILR
jgi:hypothetical protein